MTRYTAIAARALAVAAIPLLAAPASAAGPALYSGTMRLITRTGSVPQVPPFASLPTFGGTLNVTQSGGVTISPGDANWSSTAVRGAAHAVGILQQTSIVSLENTDPGTARPGNGPGPFAFAFPTPMGSPPVNATYGVSARRGAVSAAAGPAQFGGTLSFLFDYRFILVGLGSFGGADRFVCGQHIAGPFGKAFTATLLTNCVGLTGTVDAPLPAATLPSYTIPVHFTVTGWPATTGMVYAHAPSPVQTTTLTATGSDARNAAGTTGMLQLVAPLLVQSQRGDSSAGLQHTAFIAEITLTLMPEPAPTVMLLAGLAGLVALRRGLFARL